MIKERETFLVDFWRRVDLGVHCWGDLRGIFGEALADFLGSKSEGKLPFDLPRISFGFASGDVETCLSPAPK